VFLDSLLNFLVTFSKPSKREVPELRGALRPAGLKVLDRVFVEAKQFSQAGLG